MTGWSHARIWAAIALAGLCTYALRLSFVYLFGRIDSVPPRIRHVLRYVPAAVLAALVVPSILTVQPTVAETLLDDRVVAGSIATVVAWRTESVFFTIAAGMGALWAIRFGLPLF